MGYIVLDESGDLGFDFTKKKTSKFFVITLMFFKNKRPIEKIIKNIFKGFTKKEIKFHHGTLHCFKEKQSIRVKVLNQINEKDISIISIILNKGKVYTKLQDEKPILYNYVTNILLDRVFTKKLLPVEKNLILIASKRETNKFLNQNFKTYLTSKVSKQHNIEFKVIIKKPEEDKCLQAVDFICWAIFRKLEHKDDSYYNLIKNRIKEENPLFP